MIELGVRQTKTHLKRIHCYDKMAQAMIAQKSSEADTDLQKIGTDMITMFRLGKEEKQTENRLNQDFSQDHNDNEKKKKAAVRALARKRYSTTKIKARNFLTNKLFLLIGDTKNLILAMVTLLLMFILSCYKT